MFKKIFHPRHPFPTPETDASSSSESGELEIVSASELQTLTENRHFFRRPLAFEFAPKGVRTGTTKRPASAEQMGNFKENLKLSRDNSKENVKSAISAKLKSSPDPTPVLKKSRSFSFRFRPNSSAMFKVPRSKSVHFADQVQVVELDLSKKIEDTKSPANGDKTDDDGDRSSSLVYTEESEEHKTVGENLGEIFTENEEENVVDDSESDATETSSSFEENVVSVPEVSQPLDVLYGIYKHMCHTLELGPAEMDETSVYQLETEIHTGLDDLAANLKSTTEIMHTLRTKCQRRDAEAVELYSGYDMQKNEMLELQEANRKLAEENERLKLAESANGKAEVELAQAYGEIDKIVKHFELKLEENEKVMHEQQEEIESLQNKTSQAEQVRSQLELLGLRIAHVEQQLEEAMDQIRESGKVRKQLELSVESLKKENFENSEKFECDLRDLKEVHRTEIEELKLKYENEYAQLHEHCSTEKQRYEAELANERTTNADWEKLHQEKISKLEVKVEAYMELKTRNGELEAKLREAEENMKCSQKSHLFELEQVKAAEIDKIKKTQANNTQLRSQAIELNAQANKLSAQLQNLAANIAKLETELKNCHLKEKAKHKHYQQILSSNIFAVETLRKFVKSTFEVLTPIFHPDSTNQFTQAYYEYAEVKVFDLSHHSSVTLLCTFILTAIRDLVKEWMKTERKLEVEIENRLKYQKEVLATFLKIARNFNGKIHCEHLRPSPARKATRRRIQE